MCDSSDSGVSQMLVIAPERLGCLRSILFFLLVSAFLFTATVVTASTDREKPNIIFIIGEDISAQHMSRAGYPFVNTENFDRIANEGLYFSNAFSASPSCQSARTALLSGQAIWRTDSGALFVDSVWKPGMVSWPDVLKEAGYWTGFTGKVGMGHYISQERSQLNGHPAGKSYQKHIEEGSSHNGRPEYDFVANLGDAFQDAKKAGKPLFFWIGTLDAHGPFDSDGVSRFDGVPESSWAPGFMPANSLTQKRLDGYLDELESFDKTVGEVDAFLKKNGIRDNTILVITSDHGIDAMRAKTTNYEYGVRVPLAIRWPEELTKPGRVIDDFVSHIDLGPTLLDILGLQVPEDMTGNSFRNIFYSSRSGLLNPNRDAVFTAFERHSGHRSPTQPTYPRRAIHTRDFVLIRNVFHDRWPWSGPPNFAEYQLHMAWDDNGKPMEPYFTLGISKRPYEEFYDLREDPFQLVNQIENEKYTQVVNRLRSRLDKELTKTKDPVHLTGEDYFAQFVKEKSMMPSKGLQMEGWSEEKVRGYFITKVAPIVANKKAKKTRYVCRYDSLSLFLKSCRPEKLSMLLRIIILRPGNADTDPVRDK